MLRRERVESVVLQKVKDGLAKQLRDDADVIPEGESIQQMNAFAGGRSSSMEGSAQVAQLLHTYSPRHTHLSFLGSLALSVFNTLISIWLASLYFCTARMTLMATYRRSSRS